MGVTLSGKQIVIGTPVVTGANPVKKTRFEFDQNTPALVWNITHDLGYLPTITVVDDDGNVLMVGAALGATNSFASVNLTSTTATLTFTQAIAGKAILR